MSHAEIILAKCRVFIFDNSDMFALYVDTGEEDAFDMFCSIVFGISDKNKLYSKGCDEIDVMFSVIYNAEISINKAFYYSVILSKR